MPQIRNIISEFNDKCTECDYKFKVNDRKLAQRLISLHMLTKHKLKIKQLEKRYNLKKIDNIHYR